MSLMFRAIILAVILVTGIFNTSATAMEAIVDSESNRNIESVSEHMACVFDFENISAEEVQDDSNKLRFPHGFLLFDSVNGADLKLVSCCSKVGFTSFILFESDNSPPSNL